MKTRMLILAALVAALLVGGFSHNAFAKGGSGGGGDKTRIALAASSAYSNAKGKADYKAKKSEREFEAEVEHLKSLKGKTVNLFINGAQVGSAVVNSLGEANIEWSTQSGDTVPNIKADDTVQFKDASGELIVSGKF